MIRVENRQVPELSRLHAFASELLPEDLQIHGGGAAVYILPEAPVIPDHHRLFADALVDLMAKSYPEFESVPDDEHFIRFIHAQGRDMHSLLKSFMEAHPTDDPELLNAVRKLDDVTVREFDLHARLIAEGRFAYSESEKDTAKALRRESAVLVGRVGEFVFP